ncbi:MAG: hypothetical protein [Bacteriophage sp.]|nr:MAG: hypothetical protein [Bacteriophage sp.]
MTLEEFIEIVHDFIGDDTSERALKFVDDVTNGFNSAVSISSSDNEDWHKKYDELNESWRKKYMHRFFNGDVNFDTNDADDDETHETTAETITTEDLFDDKEEE